VGKLFCLLQISLSEAPSGQFVRLCLVTVNVPFHRESAQPRCSIATGPACRRPSAMYTATVAILAGPSSLYDTCPNLAVSLLAEAVLESNVSP
jgi:hypothetical protein